jgi:hypothetical protein
MQLARSEGRVPADETEASAWLGPTALAATDDSARLRYERLSSRQFRVTVDPLPTLTGVIGRWDPARYASMAHWAGKPARSTSDLGGGSFHCEVVLDDLPPSAP